MKTLLPVVVLLCGLFGPTLASAQQAAPSAALTPPAASEKERPLQLTRNDRLIQFAAGAGATAVSVPVGLLLGRAMGGISNNLYVAALPAVLTWIVLPPIAATLAEWWTGNQLLKGSTHISPALFVGLGVHLAVVVGAILLAVDSSSVVNVVALTVVSMLLVPGSITAAMWKFDPPVENPQVSWRERIGAPKLWTPTAALSVGVPF